MPDVQITFTYSSPPNRQDGSIYSANAFVQFLNFNNNVADLSLPAGDYTMIHHFYGDDGIACGISGVENPGPGQAVIITITANSYKIDDAVTNGVAGKVVFFTVT